MKKLAIILMAVVGLTACQKEVKQQGSNTKTQANVQQSTNNVNLTAGSGVTLENSSGFGSQYQVLKTVPLLAGQTENVGNITVAQDENLIYVTYNFIGIGNTKISELHLYVGDSTEIPANNSGNPIPGQFPNKITFKKVTVTSYTFSFPTDDIDDVFSVAAHCVVGGETAWGQGSLFPNANQWGMYFTVSKAPTHQEG